MKSSDRSFLRRRGATCCAVGHRVMTAFIIFFLVIFIIPNDLNAQDIPKDYQEVLSFLDRKGDYKEEVLKVNLPRNDLRVTVAGIETPTPFGFSGWISMRKGSEGHDVMMGDLVLLEEEVNPVMSALLENDLEVTALHNHFFWEQPRIFYMHVHGHGQAVDIARRIKPGLDLMGNQGTRASDVGSPSPVANLNTEILDQIIGHKGAVNGPVYKVAVGRDDLVVKEMGAKIDSRMGLNSWAAIVGTDENAAIAGDVAMQESEVTSVLKALRGNELNVVAIHHHMINSRPVVIFLHYWAIGPSSKLAAGFRAALDKLGNPTNSKKSDH